MYVLLLKYFFSPVRLSILNIFLVGSLSPTGLESANGHFDRRMETAKGSTEYAKGCTEYFAPARNIRHPHGIFRTRTEYSAPARNIPFACEYSIRLWKNLKHD